MKILRIEITNYILYIKLCHISLNLQEIQLNNFLILSKV